MAVHEHRRGDQRPVRGQAGPAGHAREGVGRDLLPVRVELLRLERRRDAGVGDQARGALGPGRDPVAGHAGEGPGAPGSSSGTTATVPYSLVQPGVPEDDPGSVAHRRDGSLRGVRLGGALGADLASLLDDVDPRARDQGHHDGDERQEPYARAHDRLTA